MSAEERDVRNQVPVTAPTTGAQPGDRKPQPAAPMPPPAGSAIPSPSAGPGGPDASRRRMVLGGIAIPLVAAGFYFGVPAALRILNTVSTDDAYVNGHVTFVAPRVMGQVTSVLVDDNDRIRKGSLLVQLDKEPYQIEVDLKKAALATAKAQLIATEDSVRGLAAQVRGNRYKLQHAIETVDNQIALLRANKAAWENRKASLTRAKADYDRAIELAKTPGAIAPQDVDQKREAFAVAQAQVSQALEAVYQVRVGLGLPAKPQKGEDLAEVPADLDQNYSSVRQALSELLASAASFGVFPTSYNLTPKQAIAEFYKRDPTGNLDRIYAELIKNEPTIKLAGAKCDQAQSELDQALLNLRYCDVVAEIDGVITRRNVNPGNNVQAGEGLMAIRSLTEIWVDANFKETQLRNLRIGQPADLEVDMYGTHKTFHGRISGFTMGTGSTLALLPAQNATGNFIKVVQRLPVRIDFTDYDPDKDPLFVGLSVAPYVHFKEAGTGLGAGQMLRPLMSNLPIEPLPGKLPPPTLNGSQMTPLPPREAQPPGAEPKGMNRGGGVP